MKTSARKAKGRRLQQWVRDQLVKWLSLDPEKVKVAVMGETGADVKLDKDIEDMFKYSIECKNQEIYKGVYAVLDQAEANAKPEQRPIGFLKMNHRQPLCILYAEDFFRIINHDR